MTLPLIASFGWNKFLNIDSNFHIELEKLQLKFTLGDGVITAVACNHQKHLNLSIILLIYLQRTPKTQTNPTTKIKITIFIFQCFPVDLV